MPYKFKGKRDCTQSDGSRGTYQTVKADGSKRCYKSEKQYKASQAYAHEADEIEEETLREYIRAKLITEITKLPKEYFSAIDDAITASSFWTEPNTLGDIDLLNTPGGNTMGTPAADALQSSIQNVFGELDLDMDVIVSSHDTDDIENMTIHPEHPAYPNRWLIDGRWYISKQNPGRSTVDLEMLTSEDEIPDLDPGALVRHIAQTVRHELVHWNQMKKQAANKGGLTDTEAFEEMLNDPKQIPDSETGTVADYLRSHIEIDAHAHDAAEELLAVYGKKGAHDILRGNVDLNDPKLPNTLSHYHHVLPDDDSTINKLNSKIYSYIEYLSEEL